MVKVSVTGGKGGTGKSLVAVNLALELSALGSKTVLADLDVECPNDHLLLGVELEKKREVRIFKPEFDYSKCTKCGACQRSCEESAIFLVEGYPFLLPSLCSGCRTCLISCEASAISDGGKVVGHTYETEARDDLTLVTGKLIEGEEKAYPVVVGAKDRALSLTSDVLVVDTSPGSGNHVAFSIEGSDVAVVVTEPTPMGVHDLEITLDLLEVLDVQPIVVLNRSNIGNFRPDEKLRERGLRIFSEIPYSKRVLDSYVSGTPIVEFDKKDKFSVEISKIAEVIFNWK